MSGKNEVIFDKKCFSTNFQVVSGQDMVNCDLNRPTPTGRKRSGKVGENSSSGIRGSIGSALLLALFQHYNSKYFGGIQ